MVCVTRSGIRQNFDDFVMRYADSKFWRIPLRVGWSVTEFEIRNTVVRRAISEVALARFSREMVCRRTNSPNGAVLCQPRVERRERSERRATLGGAIDRRRNPVGATPFLALVPQGCATLVPLASLHPGLT